jgi:hypothetical protein
MLNIFFWMGIRNKRSSVHDEGYLAIVPFLNFKVILFFMKIFYTAMYFMCGEITYHYGEDNFF